MRGLLVIALACIALAGIALGPVALAQVTPPPPELQNRVPAPLPPPPEPPVINGPLGQDPQPGPYQPPRLETYGDRITQCLHSGAGYGLRGKKLDAYVSDCAR